MNLPNDTRSERAFLSLLMNNPCLVQRYANSLHASDFYHVANSIIYSSILRLTAQKKPIDFISLTADLTDTDKLHDAGGIAEITAIAQYAAPEQVGVSVEDRCQRYYDIILECARRRDGYRVFQEAAQCAVSGEDLENLLTIAREKLPKIGNENNAMSDANSLADRWGEWYEENKAKGEYTGIQSGIPFLDKMTGGWKKGNLIVLGARPSMGKTALSLNFAVNACKEGHSVAFFSLEMCNDEIMARIISSEGSIDAKHANTPALMTENDEAIAKNVLKNFRSWKFYLDDTSAMPVSQIMAKARRIKQEKGLDLVIIDHLNFIGIDFRAENRTNEMRKITGSLKGMAKDLDVPVICLCQLSRGVESRAEKKPMLSDLRESGTIEQDADCVLLLYRDSYYSKEESDKSAELAIAKQRNGVVGTVQLHFEGKHQRFSQSDVTFWRRAEMEDIPK